jgi:multidrug efflux system membrane fusion protein
VTQAEQLADKARRELTRGEALYKDEVIALEQLENLRTQASLANAQLSAARFNRGYAVITAPRDAVVLRKLAQQRELVPAGQPVLVLGTRQRGYIVRGALADREIVRVKLGARVQVQLDAWPDLLITGKLTEIASAADERSGMFAIEVGLDPTPANLVTGLVAKLAILPAAITTEQRVYVPVAALLEGDGEVASVFVAVGGKAVKRQVQIAFLRGEQAALSQGVSSGELVVTAGAPYLRDGEAIEIADAAAVVAFDR